MKQYLNVLLGLESYVKSLKREKAAKTNLWNPLILVFLDANINLQEHFYKVTQ